MATWGFNEKQKAETLSRFGDSLSKVGMPSVSTGLEAAVVKIPAGEQLDAIDGSDAGYLACEVVQLGMSGTVGTGNSKVEVLNTTLNTFLAGEFVTVVRVNSIWMVTSGGGGGGGRTVYQLQATTGVSAASGLTTGSGTAEVLELQMPSGVYQGFGAFETVRNPWEETIATGSMLTCHLENGVYVIIQASCPSE